MKIRISGKKFQADITLSNGKRLRPSFATWEAANDWLHVAAERDKRGLDVSQEVASKVNLLGLTLRQAAEETLDKHWKGTKSEMTAWTNARDCYQRMGADVAVRDVDETKIDALVSELERDGKSNGTINRKLAALSKILRHCYRRGHIERLPLIDRKKESVGRIRWVTTEEEFKLLSKMREIGRPVMADFVEILIDTGMRFGELHKLEWRDVDFEQEVVRLWETKNGQARTIPLTRRALDSFGRQLGRDSLRVWVFRKDQFRHVWDMMKELIGLGADTQFVPHCLRHTCASRLIQRGIDLRVVKEFLGHSSIQTTLRYAHLAPKNLEQARDALQGEEPRDKLVRRYDVAS
tara:strand:- start:4361 stop:5410 length:1050 start_codon:yes stop_codon:yes gene_type:complete